MISFMLICKRLNLCTPQPQGGLMQSNSNNIKYNNNKTINNTKSKQESFDADIDGDMGIDSLSLALGSIYARLEFQFIQFTVITAIDEIADYGNGDGYAIGYSDSDDVNDYNRSKNKDRDKKSNKSAD
ncbi:hypothetical protein AWZ03_011335 [Drosophila navojoa]|uniref:Uncharacterized protein n=1 Tax=Drosophila navojoa TaxID=7232 RepID=A0A484B2D3_DRONA|nr:hypothetical protein AWZ03_011335 [Drosophila navojoa]